MQKLGRPRTCGRGTAPAHLPLAHSGSGSGAELDSACSGFPAAAEGPWVAAWTGSEECVAASALGFVQLCRGQLTDPH